MLPPAVSRAMLSCPWLFFGSDKKMPETFYKKVEKNFFPSIFYRLFGRFSAHEVLKKHHKNTKPKT
jgi:hypothetical protein